MNSNTISITSTTAGMNLTSSMDVKLELAAADELAKLLVALAESELEFTLQKAERKNRGKSNKMDVLLELHDPQGLLTLLQLKGIKFLLIKAEIKEPEVPLIINNDFTPPHITWTQPPTFFDPNPYVPGFVPIGPGILPNPPIVTPPSTGDPLPFDFWQTTCETIVGGLTVGLAGTDPESVPVEVSSDAVDLGNVCTVSGVSHDNFTGHRINFMGHRAN